MSSENFVIVHQANSRAEAELICTLLSESGVRAVVPDTNNPFPGVDLTPFSQPGGAGCDVCVPEDERERAEKIIADARLAAKEAAAEEANEGETTDSSSDDSEASDGEAEG